MKKSFLGALLITLVAHNASYAGSDELNKCLFNEIANDDSFVNLLSEGAESALRNVDDSVKTADKMAILLGQNKDYTTNFPKFFKQKTARQLVEKCGNHIIAAINNDDAEILLCASSKAPESWTGEGEQPIYFHPSTYCIQKNDDDNRYAIPVTIKSIFKYIPGTFAYIATSDDYALGEKINTNVTSDNPWDSNCSATAPFWNIPDDAAVNIAGINVFGSYLPDHEFFFDVYDVDTLAASGILLADEDGSTSEKIVVARDLKTALDNGDEFAKKIIETGRCRNLKIHLVSLLEILDDSATGLDNLAAGIGIGAGAAAAFSAASNLGWLGGALATGGAASSVPVVGWIVAGVLAATAGAIASFDQDIIQEYDRHPATVLKTWDLSLPMD